MVSEAETTIVIRESHKKKDRRWYRKSQIRFRRNLCLRSMGLRMGLRLRLLKKKIRLIRRLKPAVMSRLSRRLNKRLSRRKRKGSRSWRIRSKKNRMC